MPRPPRPTWGIPIDQTPSPLLPSPPPPPPDGRHVAFPTLGDGFHVSPTSRRPPGSSSSTRTDSSSGSGRGVPKKKKKRHLHFPEDGLACDAEIVALAKIFKGFQEKMPAKIRSSNQENTYLDLYHHMDLDQSGVVDFDEFTWMIRSELHVVASSLPDASLRALWNSLDLDGSGTICFGEFGHFMRYLSREDEDGDDPLDASAGSPLSSPLGLRSLQQQKLQSAGGAGAASRAIMLSPTPSSGLARSAPKQWPRTLSSIPPATFDQARASLGPGKSHRDAGESSLPPHPPSALPSPSPGPPFALPWPSPPCSHPPRPAPSPSHRSSPGLVPVLTLPRPRSSQPRLATAPHPASSPLLPRRLQARAASRVAELAANIRSHLAMETATGRRARRARRGVARRRACCRRA